MSTDLILIKSDTGAAEGEAGCKAAYRSAATEGRIKGKINRKPHVKYENCMWRRVSAEASADVRGHKYQQICWECN